MSGGPSLSVVVPAHNEERGLRQTLDMLLADARPGEIDVVVVPNGCSDRTAEIAGSVPGVRVLVTTRPGKAAALQLGHDACRAYPRLFLDADVGLSTTAARVLRDRLRAGDGVLACAPRVVWDLSECGPVARRAHLAHDELFGPHRVLSGVGAYLLGEEACRRVFPMPRVVADDEYVHRSFAAGERVSVPQAVSATRPAPSFRTMVVRRARSRYGNQELRGLDVLVDGPVRLGARDLARAVLDRRVRPLDGLCFLAVVVCEHALVASWRVRRVGAVWPVDRDRGRGSRAENGGTRP